MAEAGKTLSDIARFVDGDIWLEARGIHHADMLNEIAELTVARDHAEAQVHNQAETIAELRRARDEDALVIDGLRVKIALGEKLDSGVALGASVEPVPATVDDAPVVNGPVVEFPDAAVSEIGGDRVDCDLTSEPGGFEPVDVSAQCEASSPQEPETTHRITPTEYARFSQLAALGRARASIARTLRGEFGGRFSIGRVAEMMRQRWLSPAYLRSFVEFAAAG